MDSQSWVIQLLSWKISSIFNPMIDSLKGEKTFESNSYCFLLSYNLFTLLDLEGDAWIVSGTHVKQLEDSLVFLFDFYFTILLFDIQLTI